MIQLATDPNASRTSFNPASDARSGAFGTQRGGRSGHAWPFLSRQTSQPVARDTQKAPCSESCS